MEREQILQMGWIFRTDSEDAHQEIIASSNFMLCMLQLTIYYFLFGSTDKNNKYPLLGLELNNFVGINGIYEL